MTSRWRERTPGLSGGGKPGASGGETEDRTPQTFAKLLFRRLRGEQAKSTELVVSENHLFTTAAILQTAEATESRVLANFSGRKAQ
jgi:hypothetical protein